MMRWKSGGVSAPISRGGNRFEIRADFKSAQEAEEYLNEHQTDVLVTDIRMRGMSGIELIEACGTRA